MIDWDTILSAHGKQKTDNTFNFQNKLLFNTTFFFIEKWMN